MVVIKNLVYECDKCNKKLSVTSELDSFRGGWISMDDFVLRIGLVTSHRLNDNERSVVERERNFCSVACCMGFIESSVLGTATIKPSVVGRDVNEFS